MERWPALLNKEEAATYLGIGVTLLNSLRAKEEIKSVQIGSAIRYRRTDLDAFVLELKESKGKFKGQP